MLYTQSSVVRGIGIHKLATGIYGGTVVAGVLFVPFLPTDPLMAAGGDGHTKDGRPGGVIGPGGVGTQATSMGRFRVHSNG